MEFEKYKKYGAYHWNDFTKECSYRKHVLKVMKWVKEKDVLDIGCGDGLITFKCGWKGIDDNAFAIKLAQDRNVNAEVGDVYTVSGKYEAVFLGDVLEHLERQEEAINRISAITDKLYIVTPPKEIPFRPYHFREFSVEELREFMENLGWKELSSEVMYGRIYAVYEKCGTAHGA